MIMHQQDVGNVKKTRRFFLPYVLDVWQDENILDTDPYADTVLNVDIQMKIEAI